MNRDIYNSLATVKTVQANQKLPEVAAAAPVAQAAGKGVGRFIPGVGAAIGAYDAYNRAKQGDWAGAGLSALGGAASLVPGVGTAASLGIAGAQALRDKQRTGSYLPGDDEIAAAVTKDKQAQPAQAAAATAKPAVQAPPGADPKVLALQKQLIAKGAKIAADGKMGPQTQAAMKQFAVAESIKEKNMSESEKIAALRLKLQHLEEGPMDLVKGAVNLGKDAWNTGKAAVSGAKWGAANPNLTSRLVTKPGVANAAGVAAAKTAGAVARNPGKVAGAAGLAAGAAGMAAMSGKPGQPAAKPPVGGKPAAPAKAPAAPANALPDPKEVEELNKLAADLENSMDPADIELMKRYNGIINAINNRSADDKRTQGEIAASAALGDTQ
jgi:peptidoglycan hydrolase-like protein with peptidoglycan-binding domain